jgi:hypothetical protein
VANGPIGLASLPARPSAAVIEAADTSSPSLATPTVAAAAAASSDSDNDDDDGPPEIVDSKPASALLEYGSDDDEDEELPVIVATTGLDEAPPVVVPDLDAHMADVVSAEHLEPTPLALVAPSTFVPLHPPKRHRPQEPRRPIQNPFGPKRSLLHNVSSS